MDVLVNIRFSKNLGCIDLVGNKWNSQIVNNDELYDSVNYTSAGRFKDECAYFNGKNSKLEKINGKDIYIGENEDFTISFWYNGLYDYLRNSDKKFIISNKNNDTSVYLFGDYNGNIKLAISSDEVVFESTDISSSLSINDWNYFAITRKDGITHLFSNGIEFGNTDTINQLSFENNSKIGVGYDKDKLFTEVLTGYIDDFVITKDALEIINNKITVPTHYLINELDASMYEDSNIWEDKEQEYSEYTNIENRIEDLRYKTKEKIGLIEEGLIPRIINPIWYPAMQDTPLWKKPNINNAYTKGDIVKFVYSVYRCIKSSTPENPWNTSDWEILVDDYSSGVTEWENPTPDYMYNDTVIFKDRLFKSNVNYNNKIPAFWFKLNNLTNTEKAEIDRNPWYNFTTYNLEDRVSYNGKYYESTIDKNRDNEPGDETYWSESSGSTRGIPIWVQPNTYKKGDIVSVGNELYYSTRDNNKLSPSSICKTCGYDGSPNIDGTCPSCGQSDFYISHPVEWVTLKEWEQPKYSMTYNTGDKVFYNGNLYICLVNNSVNNPTNTDEWKKIANNEVFFKDGNYSSKRGNKIRFKLYDAFDNHYTGIRYDTVYFEQNYLRMFIEGKIEAFLLFINNRFIPWDKITVTRSDDFITIEVDKSNINVEIESIRIIKLPFKVVYSTTGYTPNEGFLLFSFNENGTLDGNIKIYCTDNNIHEIMYNESSYHNFFLDIDLTTKITDKNIFVFDENGGILDNISSNYTVSAGNMLNVYPTNSNYRVYCIWDERGNHGEDNYAPLPNSDMVRELLNPDNENKFDGYNLPIDVNYLKKEYDKTVTNHTFKKEYENNIDESLNKIFDYNKSKYDNVYESISPVNITEYSEMEMNALKRTISITLTEDNYNLLKGNFVLLDDHILKTLDDSNKNEFMNKKIRVKLREFKSVKLTKDNIEDYTYSSFIEAGDIKSITDNNKNNYIGQTINILQSSLFEDKTENTDTIIMSRDIYNKKDEKNDTFVMFFKRGMLPEWYKNIQYTPEVFYFTDIPKGVKHTIYFTDKPHEHFEVVTGDGRVISSTKTSFFTVEDGEDLSKYSLSVVADKGYTAGEFINKDKLKDQLVYTDLTFDATAAIINWYKVTIKDSKKDHQIITSTIYDNEEDYDKLLTDTHTVNGITYKYEKGKKINNANGEVVFYVPYNTLITSEVTAFSGYDKGTVTPEKIYITQDKIIKTNDPSILHDYSLTMVNTKPEIYSCSIDMHDIYNNKDFNYVISNENYKNPVKFITHYNNTIYPQYTIKDHRYKITGFNIKPNNSLLKDEDKYLVKNDSTVTYDSHVEKNIFSFIVDNDYANDCTVTVTIKDSITNTIRTIKNSGSLTDVPYGSEITVVSTGNRSHYYGPIVVSGMTLTPKTTIGDRTITVTYTGKTTEGNVLITTKQPEIRRYIVSVFNSAHQIIAVKYGSNTKTTDSTKSSGSISFWVTYGTTINASITKVDYGYIAGKLNITTLVVTDNVIIKASDVSFRKFTITINRVDTDHQNLVVIDTKYNRNYSSTFKADYLTRLNINNNSIIGWPGSIIVDNKTVANNNNSLSTQYSLTVDKDYTITCTNATSISGSYASYSEICAFTVPPGITKLRIRWKGNHNRSYTTGVGRVNPGQTYYMRQYNRRYNHHCHENMGTFSSYQRALSVYNSDDGRDNSAAYIESPDDPTTRRWGEYNNAGGLPFFIEWGPDINNLPDRRGG